MTSDENTVTAEVYLQVEPEFGNYYDLDDPRSLRGAKVVGYTQKKAKKPRAGTVEIKFQIKLPKGAFLPLRPEAVIVIPESMTDVHPIEVEAGDANA